MGKQSQPIREQCQARLKRAAAGRCINDAIWGVYQWASGETDVRLDDRRVLVGVFCGEHKPRLKRDWLLRNVRLRRA